MIVVSAKDLTKEYGTDVILDKVSFHINQGDRVGIIGVNGAGKTTLLKILTGEIPSEDGAFFISSEIRTGYLHQDGGFDSEKTVIEEVESIFGEFPQMEQQMERILERIEALSGGTLPEIDASGDNGSIGGNSAIIGNGADAADEDAAAGENPSSMTENRAAINEKTAAENGADAAADASVDAAIEDPAHAESRRLLEQYDALQERFKEKGGYTYKSEMTGILSSMAFSEDSYHKKISTLSGGERTRLALACLLLRKPDILFLDEPTNHLDIGTLKWLEQYLKNYKGTIVLVSHDRYFLDQTVNRIFEIENHKLSIYEGNYSFYAAERGKRREAELKNYEKQRKEIERQEEIIRRFKQRGTEKLAKRAASREKRLAAMDLVEKPEKSHGKMKLSFRENFQSGKDVMLAENLSKSFGYGMRRTELFHDVNMDIKRGERVCIVGANGIGKTTLLRMLMGDVTCNTGRIKLGHNVQIGYYDQGQLLLNDANTVIEELQDAYRLYNDTDMRNILGRFLFRGESVFLPIGSLSGGEKARLSLLKLMLSGANVLLLDEPTNHLDIESKEVFEEALLDFPGTCIIVSHDRYFLNRIPTRIMELTETGMENYLGTYDYYVEKKQQQIQSGKKYLETLSGKGEKQESISQECALEEELSPAERRRRQKEREAEERRLKRQKDGMEKEIATLEAEIANLEDAVCQEENATDPVKLAQIGSLLEEKKSSLEEKYEAWLALSDNCGKHF